MDNYLIPDNMPYLSRTVYNCYINPIKIPENNVRNYTTLDMFPSVLGALGFEIEGNTLGLGVNLFSNEQTFAEKLGTDYLWSECLLPFVLLGLLQILIINRFQILQQLLEMLNG